MKNLLEKQEAAERILNIFSPPKKDSDTIAIIKTVSATVKTILDHFSDSRRHVIQERVADGKFAVNSLAAFLPEFLKLVKQ